MPRAIWLARHEVGALSIGGIAVLTAVLVLVGGVLLLVGGVMLIINAFKVSVMWGLGVIFLAPIGLVFLVKNWQENKKSFFIQIAGLAFVIVGVLLGHPAPTQ